MSDEKKEFMIESARLIFRNFSGREGQYNREGDRNFSVVIDDNKVASQMEKDGWNVKYLEPREEGDTRTAYVPVAVSYKSRPPRIVLLRGNSRTTVDEGLVEILDAVNITNVDLIARGYDWTVNGKSGLKAYLQSLFVTIEEDYLERKYSINEE